MQYTIPKVELDGDLEESLNNIEKVIKDLNKRRDKGLPEFLEEKINQHLQISHVYHSNAIEGNQLSLRETEIVLDTLSQNTTKNKYETEAVSLNKANDYLYDLISGKARLGRTSFKEFHSIIMEGSDVERGDYRKREVTIKNSDHTPPPAASVELNVDELFQWINRSGHEYSPLIMATILHHWITWIHPFTDGNGRTARMFFNFFLLQRGYPMVIVKLEDRDIYYDALIEADKGNIVKLLDLFIKKSRQTVTIYEEFINDLEREIEWKKKYEKLALTKEIAAKEVAEDDYKQIKEAYQFDYEIWKRQVEVFRELIKESIKTVDEYLVDIDFEIEEFDMLSFNQYLDILEGRKVTNNWYLTIRIHHKEIKRIIKVIFYFGLFKPMRQEIFLFGKPLLDKFGKQQMKKFGHIKLYVMAREHQRNFALDPDTIDLVNVGTWKDQLSFGLKNRDREITGGKNVPQVITKRENPSKIVRNFVDQILKRYFSIGT